MSNKLLLKNTFNTLLQEMSPEILINDSCSYENENLYILESTYRLSKYKNIHIVGSGKAVIPMALAMQNLLKERISSTLLVGAYEQNNKLDNKTTYLKSTHPLPSSKSMQAAKALKEKLQSFDKDDFFIYLLSGGNSALVELPEDNITLEEFQETTLQMLQSGMPIEAMNCVRKHLSQVKGGKLALETQAKGVVLVLSDVVGDDLHAIGSAPLYCDTTSFNDALSFLKSYNILDKIPKNIRNFLELGAIKKFSETPKIPSANIEHVIIGSNFLLLQKAAQLLEKSQLSSTIISTPIEGDTQDVAQYFYNFAQKHQDKKQCYIFGGEATVVVNGTGSGGRNQHLCLHLLNLLDKNSHITFLSGASDGIDGNSTAAGAVIDWNSQEDALIHNIDSKEYLNNFDSNSFFDSINALLKPGPTHNNLLDIMIMLVEPQSNIGDKNG